MALFNKKPDEPALRSQPHPFQDLPLVLTSGLGRSGTTLLRNCIARHPQVACHNNESNYIFHLMRVADQKLPTDNILASLPSGEDEFWRLHKKLVLNMYWPVTSWKTADRYQAISTYSMLDPRAAMGLKKTFDRLTVCYIVRNGIEVVSSYSAFPAFQHLTFSEICKIWALRQDMFRYQRSHDHVFLFRYEWFRDRPLFKQHLAQALGFAGLKFESRCLAPLRTTYHPTTFPGETEEASKDPELRKDRWKLWTDQQRHEFASICGDAMKIHGYDIPWLKDSA